MPITPRPRSTTIITDCQDANARGRVTTRAAGLLQAPVSFIGVASDLEAAGNIIDALDATTDLPSVVLANVAPRNGAAKQWPNGTPFGYFYYHHTLVIAAIDGAVLSLVKKLALTNTIHVFNISEVMEALTQHAFIDATAAQRITATQFRSFEFLPRAAAWLVEGYALPATPMALAAAADTPAAVWWVDNFGNCKTTLLADELTDELKNRLHQQYGCGYYERLKDVPDGSLALVSGSSGLGERRFIEIVQQGGSAAQTLGLKSGDTV